MGAIKNLSTNVLQSFKKTLFKYPVTMGICFIFAVLFIYRLECGNSDLLERALLILEMAAPLSLAVHLFFIYRPTEKKQLPLLVYLAITFLLLLYNYFCLQSNADFWVMLRHSLLSFVAWIIWLLVPFLCGQKNFYGFFAKIFASFFSSVLFSQVLSIGVMAIIFAADQLLFSFDKGEIYFYLWLFITFVFTPGYFLAQIPLNEEEKTYSPLIKILFCYIILPVFFAYSMVLYVYCGKILFTMTWPRGIIVYLAIAQMLVGLFLVLILEPLEAKLPNFSLKKVRFAIPCMIIPVLVMYFIAIFMRVADYGLTESRYYIILIGIWIFCSVVWLIIKKCRSFEPLVACLVVFAVVSVLYPVSANNLSFYSQANRLENILMKYDMLNSEQTAIIPVTDSSKVTFEDKKTICSILDYFNYKNHDKIAYYPQQWTYEQANSVLGFARVSLWDRLEETNQKQNFNFEVNLHTDLVPISDDDFMINERMLEAQRQIKLNDRLNLEWIQSKHNANENRIVIYQNQQEIASVDFNQLAEKLYHKYGQGQHFTDDLTEMSLVTENDQVTVKCVVNQIAWYYYSQNELSSENVEQIFQDGSSNVSFQIFVKMK